MKRQAWLRPPLAGHWMAWAPRSVETKLTSRFLPLCWTVRVVSSGSHRKLTVSQAFSRLPRPSSLAASIDRSMPGRVQDAAAELVGGAGLAAGLAGGEARAVGDGVVAGVEGGVGLGDAAGQVGELAAGPGGAGAGPVVVVEVPGPDFLDRDGGGLAGVAGDDHAVVEVEAVAGAAAEVVQHGLVLQGRELGALVGDGHLDAAGGVRGVLGGVDPVGGERRRVGVVGAGGGRRRGAGARRLAGGRGAAARRPPAVRPGGRLRRPAPR